MGTRSTYRVLNKIKSVGTPILLLYAQFDGYPEGHPLNTAKWLASGKVVNGVTTGDGLVFNGAGCLAAQLVALYKKEAGGFYIESIDSRGQLDEEYVYDIMVSEKGIEYIAYEVGWDSAIGRPEFNVIFRGTPEEYVEKYSK